MWRSAPLAVANKCPYDRPDCTGVHDTSKQTEMCEGARERRRERRREWQRERYQNDPEYREQKNRRERLRYYTKIIAELEGIVKENNEILERNGYATVNV